MYEKQRYLLNCEFDKVSKFFIGSGFFIAGGAITSVFTGKKVKDLDIYFISEEKFNEQLNKFNTDKIFAQFSTDNALSYEINGVKIQLIKVYYGMPSDIISKFDFTVCMAAYAPGSEMFLLGDKFLEHNCSKTLVVNPYCDFPISTLCRVRKYVFRGYHLPAVESIKLSLAINNLKLETYHDLKKHIEGIDTLFLKPLTDGLLGREDEKYEFEETMGYINGVLEKILSSDEE